MSDHISGPRALADPIADITDVYAFPSPERPGHLVLVVNTLPFAQPSDGFSDALVYRFRLRPLRRGVAGDATPFHADATEVVVDCVFAERGADGKQVGTCKPSTGAAFDFTVGDEGGGSSDGVRVFAGLRWDPFILDAPAALKTIATGQLQFTDAGSIYLDGKNVLGLVVELDCERMLGDADAGRGRRRDADAREPVGAHRARRPAGDQEPDARAEAVRPGQPRPRDPRPLQHGGRVRARRVLPGGVSRPAERQPCLLGQPGRGGRLARRRRRGPSADRAAARRLPRRRRHEAVRRGRLLPRAGDGRAPRRGARDLRRPDAQRRRHGPAVHAGHQCRERADHPRRRRRVDASRRRSVFPYLAVPNPDPPKAPPPHSH